MRNKLILSTAMLLLAATGVASAQKAAAKDTAQDPAQWFTLGYRGSSVDGDKGRWERYRDLRDGVMAGAEYRKETDQSALKFSAGNIGYHDQNYVLDYNKFGKLKLTASWNSTPLNYAYNTLTPWQYKGNNAWSLDPAARQKVQDKVAGVIGIGTNAATDLPSIYRGLATNFPMQARRDALNLGMKYRMNDQTVVDLAFSTTNKTGNQPYGAAFAFNDANELPMAVDNRTNDMTAGLEWANGTTGMLRVEWAGSWFKNQFASLTWDNPLRATDFNNGKAPPAGPYDASGYSNGNGPAFGRLAMAPSNSMNTFRVMGLYKMPGRSTLNGQIALTTMTQDDDLIPFTTNSMISTPQVYALFPGLAKLPRATAEAEVRGLNALLNYTTRPTDNFALDIRYRFNDHENRTPHFNGEYNVRFDAVPEYVPGTETEHFNIRQNTLETGATFTLPRNTSFKVGYILDDVKREGRAFSDMTDYTLRLSLDTWGNQYLMVRSLFERTRRIGNGLSLERIEEGGGQHALRFYDEADMDRTKGTVIVQLTPSDKWDLGLTLATGKDEYRGEGHEFGLLDNDNTSYNATLTFYPTDKITFGGNYGTDKFSSLQTARNANPFSGVVGAYESWNDPNRNWSLDNDETVNSAGAFIELTKPFKNTDIRFSYDYSNSDNAFVHSGPRITELRTNTALTTGDTKPCATGFTSCFIPFPNVTNTWTQMKVELKHMFRPTVGMGIGYWYEKFDITDFATTNLADGSPRMDPLGMISTGYGNRPYSANTTMLRMIIKF